MPGGAHEGRTPISAVAQRLVEAMCRVAHCHKPSCSPLLPLPQVCWLVYFTVCVCLNSRPHQMQSPET